MKASDDPGDDMRARREQEAAIGLERTDRDDRGGGGWSRQAPPQQLAALGRAIGALRRERGLSEEALASGAELRPSYVLALEAGELSPSFHVLVRLATALGVSVAELAARYEREGGEGRG
jgi:ribosome-binding protein aMBF1 (putative translation factor)